MAFQTGILNMFARSPFKPLQKHMEKAHGSVALLETFFEALTKADWEQARKLRRQIQDLEHEADAIKMDFRQHLPKSLFLPVPRMDLLELLSKQENLANIAKDISGLMLGRKMNIPKSLVSLFMKFLKSSIDASNQAKTAISELDELLESGFRGKEVDIIETLLKELNRIEHESDELQIELRQSLFDIEDELRPVDVVFLYKIIDWVGYLADTAQDAGARLRMLTAD